MTRNVKYAIITKCINGWTKIRLNYGNYLDFNDSCYSLDGLHNFLLYAHVSYVHVYRRNNEKTIQRKTDQTKELLARIFIFFHCY